MKRIIALSLAITTGAAMAYASGDEAALPLDDAKAQEITQVLSDQGYEVLSVGAEEDGFEAYAMKDGTKWEIELDADLAVTETEAEDGGND